MPWADRPTCLESRSLMHSCRLPEPRGSILFINDSFVIYRKMCAQSKKRVDDHKHGVVLPQGQLPRRGEPPLTPL
eukprot:1195009-Prorocentrum_minimum.AAC.1